MEDLKKFLDDWDTKDFPIEDVLKIGREYFLITPEVKKFIEDKKLDPFSAGIFLGQKKKHFEPSMALINMLNKNNSLVVDDKTAWLFGCGRDIFENSIKEINGKRNKFLVLNQKGEIFGYATKSKEGKKFIYKNRMDIGNYLRREQSKR